MHLLIRLLVPGRTRPLAILGEVAREGDYEGCYALGVEFGSLPLKVLGDLMAFLHRLSRVMDAGQQQRSCSPTPTETQRGWVGYTTAELEQLFVDDVDDS